ncbi:MAG TPA: trypsin-like peptidase domain-containing protein [Spirochaetia bacterium]|nr:trypsin-like peptidase domain-containing protein [Spirochaetia bacterium]
MRHQSRRAANISSRVTLVAATFAAAIFAAVTLVACASAPQSPAESAAQKADPIPELTTLLSSSSPQAAFPRILYYKEHNLLPAEKLAAFKEEGISALQKKLATALSGKEYQQAAAYLESLDTLHTAGILVTAPKSPENQSELALKRADAYFAAGNEPAALDVFIGIHDLATVASGDQLDLFGRLAVTYHNRSAVQTVVAALESRKVAVPAKLSAFLARQPSAPEMLAGTATIWINEGITMQNGLGYPTIVIGSGFFIDKRGYLITNYHVISGMVEKPTSSYAKMHIVLPGRPNDQIPAHVVGYSRVFDIALLKTDIKPAYLFSFSRTRSVDQGEQVMAMGSPGGLDNTVTSGIVSATDRQLQQMGDAMQIDVPVNPGNSGGPLLTAGGDLVGVVFAGIQTFHGVNFAISSYWISKFLPELYAGGEVKAPWIGAAVAETDNGLSVIYVAPGSPAAGIGLEEHDLITSINGRSEKKITDVQDLLLSLPPASLVSINWTRAGKKMSGLVVPGDRPFDPVEAALKRDTTAQLFPLLFGMDVTTKAAFMRQDFVITSVQPGGVADETGLSRNDVFSLIGTNGDPKAKTLTIRLQVLTRKPGFPQRAIELTAPTELPNFI